MDVSEGGQMFINPTFDDWIYENDIPPVPLKTSRQMDYWVENADSTRTMDFRQAQHDQSQGRVDFRKMKPTSRSNRSVLMLMSIVCLISFVIFVLILLMSVGKLMKSCGCPSGEASPNKYSLAISSESEIIARIMALEGNVTSLKLRLLNSTAENLENNEKRFHAHIANLTSSLNYMTDELKNELNTTRSHMLSSAANIRDSVAVSNSTLALQVKQLKTDLEVVHSLANDTRMQLNDFKINTTSSFALTKEDLQVLTTGLNSTRSNLQDVDVDLRKSLVAVNATLVARSDTLDANVNKLSSILATTQNNFKKLNETLLDTTIEINQVSSSVTMAFTLANQTENTLNAFKNSTEKSLMIVSSGLTSLEEGANQTKEELSLAISNTNKELKNATDKLSEEDITLKSLLETMNTTLSTKIDNVSKLQGPIGPQGFNGSQGPVGPAGPTGFNGTQGNQGVIGPQGFNGSQGHPGAQGPQGAGDFSQCAHKTAVLKGSQNPVTSNSFGAPVKVILGEPNGKKIVGVSCSTDNAQLYLVTTETNQANGQLFYYCNCYGHHGSGSASVNCVMHYWECPLTT